MTQSLLGPNAMPMVCIGGKGAWKQRQIKGILCSFQWVDLSAQGFEEGATACMCLLNPRSSMRGAYVIPQPHAYLFGDKRGNPTSHLFTSGFAAAEQLGFDLRDKSAIGSIIDIIIEALPDLIWMPSEPPDSPDVILRNAVQGIEARARVNGKTIHEEVL